ncbi:MAG: hypothetical protein JWP41_2350 [Ramlibacter sp.]|nr:hypothetical protein [Ramlibacter sp.]
MGPFTTLLGGTSTARTECPAREISAQCEYILFAAALFVGCTMFEGSIASARASQSMARPVPATAARASQPAAAPVPQDRAFAEAVLLYRAGRWSASYGHFMALADAGHVRSARIALAMQRDGADAYGTSWDATTQQLLEWEHTAGGAPLALHASAR